ncbi:MAG: 10 kDa chaperonin [Microgenomates group bacterium GW2011_GWA1_Microgenomates_45_10]|nr:MAG: 10 kDa chaperonin [Microgenomates group bacterium GW2011_GWA2_44_7]KKT78120.1 MAG: 10 kDa chaperonin [Microgenomates group bacterium GW2011_GWB1_44_8]KKT87226.1 MAG: 10 kDa chaperonin [Microgenomates group bacterium GW2011_GWA1_Microgenomates_45_10]
MANSTILDISKIKPAAGYLLVEPVEAQKKTAAGIYLPESHDEKPQEGKVLAVGPDELTDAGGKRTAPAAKGAMVIYKKWGGNEVKVQDKEYQFLKFDDVLAVIS